MNTRVGIVVWLMTLYTPKGVQDHKGPPPMKLLIIISLTLGLIACDGHEASDPVTRCIAYGHKIDKCIELAEVLHCKDKD